ncbi:hypothetical protein ACFYXM_11445 [Streptomyces sp. NPDC002476]|uniref:hypothetical protein n=1 Tax=Streptomyces sp. NPDC002476 TaxID=3364648 RepID=UPI003686626F
MLSEVPDPEARIPAVTEVAQVGVDDLLVIVDTAGTSSTSVDIFGVLTGREVMESASLKVAKVVSTTAKTVSVVTIPTPSDGWACNLEGFAEHAFDPSVVTLTLRTKTRRVGRLGTASEIRQQITGHALFSEWRRAYESAKTARKELQTAVAAATTAKELQQQALKRVAGIFNRAMGVEVIDGLGFHDTELGFGGAYRAFFRREENLRIHLAGLRAVGKLTDVECELVTAQLTAAGMLTAPSGSPASV